MNEADRIEIGESVIFQTLDDEVVILNMANQQYYGLDSIGANMWKKLLEYRSIQPVVDELTRNYDVDAARLKGDLQGLVQELIAAGLLRVSPNGLSRQL